MRNTTYTLFHNTTKYRDADNLFGDYRPGAQLVRYYQGTVLASEDLDAAAWELFQRHNRDGRPCGQLGPSLSNGDVIVFGDDPDTSGAVAVTLTHDGEWVPVAWNEVLHGDLLPGTYLHYVARERASR